MPHGEGTEAEHLMLWVSWLYTMPQGRRIDSFYHDGRFYSHDFTYFLNLTASGHRKKRVSAIEGLHLHTVLLLHFVPNPVQGRRARQFLIHWP